MRIFLRRLISSVAYLFVRREKEGTLRVLTYHRVNSVSPKDRLSVKTEAFRKQIASLYHEGYHTVTPEELLESFRLKKPLPKRTVLITFDDGYEDNFREAWPILKEFGFKATIFVATGLVGETHDGRKMLTWDQIRTMAAQGISFGSHTLGHVHLDEVSSDEKREEATLSKQALEEELEQKIISFCYPFGDYDAEAKEVLRKAGYELAFTTKPGPVRGHSDRLELPRTEVSGFDSLFDFKKKLAGAFDWLHAMAQRERKKNRRIGPVPVLHIIWSLGLGGAEQVVISLTRKVDRTRFRPMVACLNEAGSFAEILEKEGIRVIALCKKGKFDLSVIPKLMRIMKGYRVQVVHTHLWGANVWGRIAAWLAKVPVRISTEHGLQEWRGPFHYAIDRLLSYLSTRLVFVSFRVREEYRRATGIGLDKCTVIPNGIDADRFSPAEDRLKERRALGLPLEGKVVLSVGRLAPEKQFHLLLKAMTEEELVKTDATLVIVGSGKEEAALLQLKETLKLDGRVQFLGQRDELERFYRSADLFVLSSSREALSLALLEAMASGIPAVVSAAGDHPRVIQDGVNGFLVPVGDVRAFAEKIAFLIDHPEEAGRIGKAARQTVLSGYTTDQMVRSTEALYGELLRHA